MAYKIYLTRNFSRQWHIFTKCRRAAALQSKELELAPCLHTVKTWEERAEDPFRGLRAGPASFSPFFISTDGGKKFLKSRGFPRTSAATERAEDARMGQNSHLSLASSLLKNKASGVKKRRRRCGFELAAARLRVAR